MISNGTAKKIASGTAKSKSKTRFNECSSFQSACQAYGVLLRLVDIHSNCLEFSPNRVTVFLGDVLIAIYNVQSLNYADNLMPAGCPNQINSNQPVVLC